MQLAFLHLVLRCRLSENQMQKTLKSKVFTSGIGLFTGEKVSIRIHPAPADSGIVFQRIDLPNQPLIPARVENVIDTHFCTRLMAGNASVMTVEHLLSALSASGIDNALIEVEGPEIPVGDGSAQMFIDLIDSVGVVELDVPKRYFTIHQPLCWSDKEIHLIALPSSEMRISYTLHFPRSRAFRTQYFSFLVCPELYREEIAPCRTFSFYEEISFMIEKGLIKGGGLENALVIKDDQVFNPGGARFEDEMVRHKILDLIGDLSLIGVNLKAHIIAIRSGHRSNVAFAKTILNCWLSECEDDRVFTSANARF
jgi:UDP-3-O-[3-hydroxymyristoyl] N-acetylglucosamine deacetylase